ncbi:MAG: DNA/RNA nuclease SfsA [Lachnospiraceae bacterium]|nr:DNA/RNA nuclease SfsA [Lachnospiraceae bacterium]
MYYKNIVQGTFLSRPNRFIALVEINGRTETCHVKNTGRCRELLLPGVCLILEHHPDAAEKGRKTAYDVVGVYKEPAGYRKERLLINMDSQAPNQAAWEWVQDGGLQKALNGGPQKALPEDAACPPSKTPRISQIRREVTHESSRFDLAFLLDGKQAFMEVKGVTLEQNGVAAFPDAPTQRGIKHLNELAACAGQGIPAFLLLVIQMEGILSFRPNMETHPEFGHALARAQAAGVRLLACDCLVTEHSMCIRRPVPIDLSEAYTNL